MKHKFLEVFLAEEDPEEPKVIYSPDQIEPYCGWMRNDFLTFVMKKRFIKMGSIFTSELLRQNAHIFNGQDYRVSRKFQTEYLNYEKCLRFAANLETLSYFKDRRRFLFSMEMGLALDVNRELDTSRHAWFNTVECGLQALGQYTLWHKSRVIELRNTWALRKHLVPGAE
jgi:hypothetical protein